IDKDGKLDLVTLFGQGDERIVWYKNNGNLQFTAITLLRFPPVYGSSSFELTDFNKDGLLDILYTAGDNSDFSVELKHYHGVYVFTNQGKNTFKQTYFHQMNGAHKVKPKVPAHRVVNRNGMLSGRHHFSTPTKMEELLNKEGIKVVDDTIVDFKNLFWDPASLI
ncbi:MAG: hypothetical protein EOO04_37920, partial [Chitinophagaceae bacterium]